MSLAVIKLKYRDEDRFVYCGAHMIIELPHSHFDRSHIVMKTPDAINLVNHNLALRAKDEGFEWASVVTVTEKSPFADWAVAYFREFV